MGERAALIEETLPDDVSLLYLEARALLGTSLHKTLETATEQGALISIDLGGAYWIRSRGGSKTAYQLATIRHDILFAAQDSAAELGAPLEGPAAVPLMMLGTAPVEAAGRAVLVAASRL